MGYAGEAGEMAWTAHAVQEWDREASFPRTTWCPCSKSSLGSCMTAEFKLASIHLQGSSANTWYLFCVDNMCYG